MTCEGGMLDVPSAFFKIDSTTAIFTKLVMRRRTKGSSESADSAMKTSTGCEASPCVLSTFATADVTSEFIARASQVPCRETPQRASRACAHGSADWG